MTDGKWTQNNFFKWMAVTSATAALIAGSCNAGFNRDDRLFGGTESTELSLYSTTQTANPMIVHTIADRVPLSDDAAHVRQILVMHSESSGGIETMRRSHSEAFKLAASLRDKLSSGAAFEELARSYSDCPSGRLKGGDIGIILRGDTLPAFEKALFELDDNGVSSVIETDFGFHILQRLSHS